MKYAELTTPKPGIVCIHYQNIIPTSEEFDEYLMELTDYMRLHDQHIVIMDGTPCEKYLPADLRKRLANWMSEHFDELRARSPLYIYVVPSTIAQLMIKGVFLLTKSPVPYKVVDSKEKAYQLAYAYWAANQPAMATY